ncbi:MAG: phosphonate ABC transporter, permease protein PhnE [Pseudomonadota bacterium]|nr:phosphonate ABC transporter, permease protein PhnE [Pseudomonadota bacterium]
MKRTRHAPAPSAARPWIRRPEPALAAVLLLVAASFASLDLHIAEFLSADNLAAAGRFSAELLHPALDPGFVAKVGDAALETLAMSALGTALAAVAGLLIARLAPTVRPLLNVLRSVPELVWASLLLIAVGLGPFAGTLALALHTTGVLGRLYLETFENLPPEAAFALRSAGASATQIFCYAELPQALPQLVSYTVYRWENNIRAAAVLGVVGAGGLGQMLAFHLQLFQLGRASTVILAMLVLVAVVDAGSALLRARLA